MTTLSMQANDNPPPSRSPAPLAGAVRTRVREKIRAYEQYRFSSRQSRALNIFFDLAQEFDETELIQLLCVLVLRLLFRLEAELYCKNGAGEICLCTPKSPALPSAPPPFVPSVRQEGNLLYLPVRGKQPSSGESLPDSLLGILVTRPDTASGKGADDATPLFLEKFANRAGYCLHNRILAERHLRHVRFLRTLARDIGHNVITPNMRIKLLLRHLEEQMATLGTLDRSGEEFRSLQASLRGQVTALAGHFQNGALFLESLLRQSHFDLGRYALRCARLDIGPQVVLPQLEEYRVRLEERGIRLDPESYRLPDEPCLVLADLGLISQTLANLLSNAVKYARPYGEDVVPRTRCTLALIPDAFSGSGPGVRVTVVSTGPPLAREDEARLFHEDFRAADTADESGTGHGLSFVQEIVTAHHGLCGYERLPGGNAFYFLLPLAEQAPEKCEGAKPPQKE
ncbi:MAG: HAMP domain-containing histidine kinase [Desulfovibrio sp.]|nr:HAMP domain-containing histidine kinase [Desulfovibrio sp.]